ncbi:agarase [Amycolatopsis mediterranei]|uniref:agarase n=1 Tax=Amycolatopsis mediterranei TaxID=33910 RepID=UPI0034157467
MSESATFRIEQTADRWTFIDPAGARFVSVGVAHADETNLMYPHNLDLWRQRYGSKPAWLRNGLEADLRAWGFTTISATEEIVAGRALAAAGGPVDIAHSSGWPTPDYLMAQLPHCVPLRPLEIESWNGFPAYRDVESANFVEYCDYVARRHVLPHAANPLLLGYFLTDAPRWQGHPSGAGFTGAESPDRLHELAEAYYRTITTAIRRYDPHHLILGDRYGLVAGMPEPVLAAAAAYVDAWSVQVFTGADTSRLRQALETFDALHERTGKPILIADTGNWCATPTSPHRASDIPDQRSRAAHYIRTISAYASRPWLLGWHWCGYLENPTRGVGMKNPNDEPYLDFVEPVTEFNQATTAALGHGMPAERQ